MGQPSEKSERMNTDWMLEGICRETDPELFFPEGSGVHHGLTARKLCRSCPVQSTCFDFAMDNMEIGIWGGTNERERAFLRKEINELSINEIRELV